jgi:steroid 5-alpha reductase family enzyme
MTDTLAVFGTTLLVTLVLMLSVWLMSAALGDVSIVDIFWGLGFVLIGLFAFALADGYVPRRVLVALLTTIWGVRLALYLLWRNWGQGEDYRYQAMRRQHGTRFAIVSLYSVFGLQGALMWIVSLPVQVAAVARTPSTWTWFDGAGVALWAIGLWFEAVGDWQLARFKSDPANRGKVMNRGLWAYTRHPNYFGDACVWWGIALVAAETTMGRFGLVGALVMTVLLRRVSGVVLLEKSLKKRKPGYDEYVARTSAFVPRPTKSPRT